VLTVLLLVIEREKDLELKSGFLSELQMRAWQKREDDENCAYEMWVTLYSFGSHNTERFTTNSIYSIGRSTGFKTEFNEGKSHSSRSTFCVGRWESVLEWNISTLYRKITGRCWIIFF
jgi:hypothetical protein